MVIYVRCRSYGTWFPRTGRSSSLRGFILDRDYSPEDDRAALRFIFVRSRSHTSQVRSVRRIYFTAFLATYRVVCVRTSPARHDYSKASFVQTTFHAAIHRTRLSGEISCIVETRYAKVCSPMEHIESRGCVACSVCVCRTKRATSRVTVTKQIPEARVDIQLARNYRIVNSLSGFSR